MRKRGAPRFGRDGTRTGWVKVPARPSDAIREPPERTTEKPLGTQPQRSARPSTTRATGVDPGASARPRLDGYTGSGSVAIGDQASTTRYPTGWGPARRPPTKLTDRYLPVPMSTAGIVRARILKSSPRDHRSMYDRSHSTQRSNSGSRRASTCHSPVIPGFTLSRRRCHTSYWLHLVGERRARTHEAHLPSEDVPELGQFVQAGATKK